MECVVDFGYSQSLPLKVFPEGLMVDMTSKNISRCTVSYTALPMKTDLHFQPTLSKLQNFQQTSIEIFFVSSQFVQNVVALTHFISTSCATRRKHV